MGQEDKLKREIDLIGKLLAKLLSDLTGIQNSSESEEVMQSIQQALKDQLNLDFNTLMNSSLDEFQKKIGERTLADSHLQQIADLFYQLAEQEQPIEKKEKSV